MSARPTFRLMSLTLVMVLFMFSLLAVREAQANSGVNVDVSVFHDAMAPYGNWVNHRTYGRVWYPHNVGSQWRPYTDGYWAHTDDYGWLWVSNESWGWAPYHYGRWAWDNWYGWIWVPGRTWAPAWVFWRSGGGYAAWAPMPPNVMWQSGVGLNISYFNYDRDLRWDSWVAVREREVTNRNISRHIRPRSNNREVINATHYTNNVTLMNKRIVNQGIPVSQIEAVTHQPVMSVKPKVYDSVESNKVDRHHGQPDIIQLPLAGATHAEIHQNEELARRLDGKNEDGTRTELPLADSGLSGHHEPRVAGRLKDTVAHVQGPYVPVESASLPAADAIVQDLPQVMRPEKKSLGLELDAQSMDSKRIDDPQGLGVLDKNQALLPISPLIATVSPPIENIQAPLLANSPEVDTTVLMPVNKSPIVTTQQAFDGQPVEQVQREVQQRQQQEMAGQQALQAQHQVEQQAQQAEQVQREAQQQVEQQQDMASQQALQAQQQVEQQAQQAEQVQREVQQRQQQEMAGQQALQAQQQVEQQAQQAEQAQREVQQRQQQEMASQQAFQAQQQVEQQAQQAEQVQREVQQRQQQEMASQQAFQAQQQVEQQAQQAEQVQREVQQRQQQEMASQQALQAQQQVEQQAQQAEQAQREAQQRQQQEMASQQASQAQQQVEQQAQQAEQAQREAQQRQQQEMASQQAFQAQQQAQQAEQAQRQAKQRQQQEMASQQTIQAQPQ